MEAKAQQGRTQTVLSSPRLGLHQKHKFEWASTQGPPTPVSLPFRVTTFPWNTTTYHYFRSCTISQLLSFTIAPNSPNISHSRPPFAHILEQFPGPLRTQVSLMLALVLLLFALCCVLSCCSLCSHLGFTCAPLSSYSRTSFCE
jgi:hypothetical protein